MWLKVLKSTSRIFITQKVDRVMRMFKTSYMQNCVILDEMWLKVLKVPAVFLSCKERIELGRSLGHYAERPRTKNVAQKWQFSRRGPLIVKLG